MGLGGKSLFKISNMKATIHPDFLVRTIAGESILIGCGDQIDFSKILMLNDTSAFLVRKLQEAGSATDEALAGSLTDEYDVDSPAALADTRQLLLRLEELGVVTIVQD